MSKARSRELFLTDLFLIWFLVAEVFLTELFLSWCALGQAIVSVRMTMMKVAENASGNGHLFLKESKMMLYTWILELRV